MITKLRARHRAASVALALVAPGVLAAGLLARRPMPVSSEMRRDAQLELAGSATPLADSLFGALPLRASLGTSAQGGDVLVLEALDDLEQPDLLVYWIDAAVDDSSGVPGGARLLGSLGGAGTHVYALPDGAAGGSLLLYSLAHQRRVAAASLAPR